MVPTDADASHGPGEAMNAPLATDPRHGVPHGWLRARYLWSEPGPYAKQHQPERVRRGYEGDKLRRKAFEGKL